MKNFPRIDSVQLILIHFRHLLRIVKGLLIDNPFAKSLVEVALGLLQVPHGPLHCIKVFIDFHEGCANGRSQTGADTESERKGLSWHAITSYDIIKIRKG